LPAAIFSLVLLSALVAGALFVSTEELRSGRGDSADQRALAAAEWALDRAILTWDPRRNLAQPVGRTDTVMAEYGPPNDAVVITATRVQRAAVWVTATATRGGDGRGIPARHTVGASLRLVGAGDLARAALTTPGTVLVDGGIVDGRDVTPVGDSAAMCTETASAPGIAVPDVSRVTCATCATSAGSGVFGTPPIDSSGIVNPAFAALVAETSAALVRRASIDLPGGTITPRPAVVNAMCDLADPLNWGDPGASSACADWFPVIHVRGSVVLGAGSVGQGILVADGSVRIEGAARFVGVVVAGADITVSGLGAEIAGAAIAGATSTAALSLVTDGGAIRFGSCAVQRAAMSAARLVRTPGRWWVELR
jgi:hypothetical protein